MERGDIDDFFVADASLLPAFLHIFVKMAGRKGYLQLN